MAGPDYHGWTHRPKADGGTDPIEIPGSLPVSAFGATQGLHSISLPSGATPLLQRELWITPGAPFAPEGGNPASYNNIMITEDGWYRADFVIYWSTVFTGANFPYMEPWCVVDGTPDNLVALGSYPTFWPVWDTTQSWIGGEQFNDAGELAHKSLYASVFFNLSFSVAGFTTFGVSNTLRTSFTGTKSVGGHMVLTRLGDYLQEVT